MRERAGRSQGVDFNHHSVSTLNFMEIPNPWLSFDSKLLSFPKENYFYLPIKHYI